ncbi:MAG: urate hydroxylase PuuD [Azospirillaceae bacterium]|nr:urate hydroxylase PuuD [Azospirillaceae bacterium]
MTPIVWEWVRLCLRWLHVIAGIAWIGSSFYFIALDLSLRRRDGLPAGTSGEAWQVHGGGFYRMMKYLVAPPELPEDLTWFMWEAYTTWISGFLLLCAVYYVQPELFLIDPRILDLPDGAGIAIGLLSLAAGWVAYDRLCKSRLGANDVTLVAAGYVLLVGAAILFTHVFGGRAAFVHTGALIGTMMVANVFFIIIPNQRKVVASLLAGQTPDPMLGKQAKQRSLHNNYLTLPVLFLMISTHYPLTFASRWNWAIVAVVLVMGAVIRHFFNSRHAGKPVPWWTWAVAAVGLAIIIALGSQGPADRDTAAAASPTGGATAAAPGFAVVEDIVTSRCAMCHAAVPVWDGIATAPKGVRLDSPTEIRRHAPQILIQAVLTNAMPPANLTGITAGERAALAAWLAHGAAAS